MTCQECELLLAGDQPSHECDGHLAGCAACRELALELSANSDAFRLMAAEPMPVVVIRRPRPLPWVAAAVAIAAMIVLMLAMPKPHADPVIKPPTPIVRIEPSIPVRPAPVIHQQIRRTPKKNVQPEILQVKMLTDDPNVVIYWQIENKKGSE
jgi:hypothetical protein